MQHKEDLLWRCVFTINFLKLILLLKMKKGEVKLWLRKRSWI